jgi:hypothetical protein
MRRNLSLCIIANPLIEEISTGKSASVYRWREVAIAAPTLVTAQRMQQVIADFDAGPKSGCVK